jgi:hypothetical protein
MRKSYVMWSAARTPGSFSRTTEILEQPKVTAFRVERDRGTR